MLQPIANRHPLLSPTYDNVSPPPFLPDDLIEKILLRLPCKYLLQYKCVCKLWKTLISDSQFTMKHLLYSTSDPSLLFQNPSTNVQPDCFNGFKRDTSYDIIGSYNGLLCVYNIDKCCVLLYNPSIKLKSKKSPKFASSCYWFVSYSGFGYDQVNDKYKALVSLSDDSSQTLTTKIYTFGEDSWRTISNPPCTPICTPIKGSGLRPVSGKYLSGTLNWFSYKGDKISEQYMILSFDLEKETYRELLLPQNVGDDYKCNHVLHVLSNCLCVCFKSKTDWVVWLMKEYGVVESWTKLTTIPRVKFDSYPFRYMLFISENGVILMSTTSSQLILYNINSGEFELNNPLLRGKCVDNLHVYCESLIPPPQW